MQQPAELDAPPTVNARPVPLPSGFRTGDQFMMELPDGRKIPVTVPKGVKAGTMFRVSAPNRRTSSEPATPPTSDRKSESQVVVAAVPAPAAASADDVKLEPADGAANGDAPAAAAPTADAPAAAAANGESAT